MDSAALANLTRVRLPARFDIDYRTPGLRVRRLAQAQREIEATFTPFRSRGNTCRRIIVAANDGQQLVVELAAFTDAYDPPVTGAVRAKDAAADGDSLVLRDASFRSHALALNEFATVRDTVNAAWIAGIHYSDELLNPDGSVQRPGLRLPQVGALHALASHWTVRTEPALVVMPTGTGKTEVMIAATVGCRAPRLLVIVPTDALRLQTADKFLSYGLLGSIGIIPEMPNPVVGLLESRPNPDHLDALRACNVVVSTMSSVGLAEAAMQQRLAALFSHVFFDEAHHIEAATWKKFSKHCSNARVVLFTATPFREDGKALDGQIVYEFPLSMAQDQAYFKPIRFVEVFEPDADEADRAIAAAAVGRLREDIAAGFNHLLMARARTIDDAERLFDEIYAPDYADLNPVVIHSRVTASERKARLAAVRGGQHRIVVCVDMFGEGFDLPNLKVAALHAVHKSIGVTLQFIGRFARTTAGVGDATFVANTAADGVPEALESLYREDADWNVLLADLSYDAINPEAQLSALVANLEAAAPETDGLDFSTLALRPKISTLVYRTAAFHPDRFRKAFRPFQHIHQPQISRRDNVLLLIINQRDALDWTDSRQIVTDSWDLYVAYYDPARQLLYIHCSRKGSGTDSFAKAISDDPQLIHGEETFKTFGGLQRLILHSVGLTGRSRNVRYQMYAGLDVRNAIDPVLQQDKMKSNVTGVGYENGRRHTVGCSRKGKIWSMASGSLAEWKTWCDRIGSKLADNSVQPNDFLRFTLIPSVVNELPAGEPLLVDWPDQLFESWNFRFQLHTGGQSHDFHDCELDLLLWTHPASFRFVARAGDQVAITLELRIIPGAAGAESTFDVRRVNGAPAEIETAGHRWEIGAFFSDNPPLVRLADASQLSGNIHLKPREALADTFDRNLVETLDWTGVDFEKESRWKDGAIRADSIQQRFIQHLEGGLATFIVDDDDTGESADIVAIEETQDTITVFLWHCKYAHGATVGERAADLYELCGQAEKGVKWTWSLDTLVKHLVVRESKHRRGRASRFIRGSANQLVTLRKSARRKFVVFRVGIVQPGFSRTNAPAEHLAIVGAANSFVQTVTDHPLLVYGSA